MVTVYDCDMAKTIRNREENNVHGSEVLFPTSKDTPEWSPLLVSLPQRQFAFSVL